MQTGSRTYQNSTFTNYLTFEKSVSDVCIGYVYGFNGMEKDDEIKQSSGTSYDFGARMYDPRIGRWLSQDPAVSQFAMITPYAFSNNSPLVYNDPTGESGELTITKDANGNPTGYVIKANLHFYTGNIKLAGFKHKIVVDQMMKQFNDQHLELTYDGKTLPVTLELTSDLTYSKIFNKIEFTSSTVDAENNSNAKTKLGGQGDVNQNDLINNYIRLEDLPIDEASFNNIGRQVGLWNIKQLVEGSTTALHEFLHSLGVKHPMLTNPDGSVIGYDNTCDAKPGEIVPLSYPRGTTYEGTTQEINPNDRRPTQAEVSEFTIHKIEAPSGSGNEAQIVIGDPGYAGQIVIDKDGNSEYLKKN